MKTWEIAPGEIAMAPPAFYLPDQLARVRGGPRRCFILPSTVVCFFKYLTDRDRQNFGFVVGTPPGAGFTIDPDEVERTLDLFPSSYGEV
ncbi:hypothetical protein PS858_00494 [Pseudomonas fluorescens]|uniref:hypothetical protein n=1 Tax=Pseudomonas fluorescens TaxID=294 RepID=UPI001252A222|nr:hypothetical protein [Pseudomonas fluorescens]VVO55293.1 hypothetical protein PS858_00494 [Pseudomonas fluorescens]